MLLGLEGEAITACADEAGGKVTSVYFGVFNFVIKFFNGVAVFLTTLLSDLSKGDAGDLAVRAMGIMAGCMLATSLAMAPAVLVGQGADFVDLDGPLLLAKDRPGGLSYAGSILSPPSSDLWG